MFVQINDNSLNVEVLGPDGAPVIIVHHGGGGIGSLAEPRASFGWLADTFRVVVYDARGCGISEGKPPFSHAQWAADLDGLRQWLGVDQVIVAGGSYGGFIAMEYAIAYPEHTRAMILRDTSPDSSNLKRVYENARMQTRVDINWDNFDRYWTGRIRDDEDLKARWAEIARLYSYEDDPERAAARVENGSYRYETHNWCFQQNRPTYDVKPALPGVRCPTLITVGRHDWVTPVESSETIAALIPDSQLVIFEKSGHSPPSDEPELFRRVVRDFLAEVAPEAFADRRPQPPR
jgi:proline iminopeptidase